MKNHEQKYKEALEAARKFKESCPDLWDTESNPFKDVFPELKESEDEKIRKGLIHFLETSKTVFAHLSEIDEYISWLEKQGEQKTEIKYVYPKFRIGDVIEPIKPNGHYPPVRVLSVEEKTKSYYCESDDRNHYSSIPIRCENEYKLVEQQPAWSEEDEDALDIAIRIIQNGGDDCAGILDSNKALRWLKSLKDRVLLQQKLEWSKKDIELWQGAIFYVNYYQTHYADTKEASECMDWLRSLSLNHWKPSKEQMKALKFYLCGYPLTNEEFIQLKSLYSDLEKL